MATLQKIRNRAGLLVAVIGFAMLAFILTDLLSSTGNLFQGGQDLGDVDGTTINYQDFERELEATIIAKYPQGATEQQRNQERDMLWDTKVREVLLNPHFNDAGVMVSSEELQDLLTGSRTGKLDPIAEQLFGLTNAQEQPAPSQISALIQRVMETDPKGARTYLYYEDLIRKNRRSAKYFNLLKEGMYITDMQAARAYNFSNATINGRYVQLPVASIQDSAVSVSEADIKSYYNENKEDYKVEAARDLSYVVFEVKPSQEDYNEALEEITELMNERVEYNRNTGSYDTIPGFVNTDDDSSFVMTHSDATAPFTGTYFKKDGGLPANLDSVMFDAEVGTVVGPYLERGSYKVAKLNKIMQRPDSVKARHILISGGENPDPVKAKALADSLYAAIENGSEFAQLAKDFSEDPGSGAEGGDLGYFPEGQMVAPFNKACFEGEVGDLVMVTSQFGYHIIEIQDQIGMSKAVRVAILSREVLPSNATADKIYRDASSFASNNRTFEAMVAAADSLGLKVQQAANVKPTARQVASLANAREIVRWAYNEKTKVGAVRMFDRTDELLVVSVSKVQPEGYNSLENVRETIETAVKRDKKKDMLMEQANAAYTDGMSIDDYAAAVSQSVKSFAGTQFANPSVTGAGFEPAWVGYMFAYPTDQVSKPYKGNNGVYVFVVDQNNPAIETQNLLTQKASLENAVKPRVEFQIFNSLKEESNVEDNRANIY